MTNPPNDARGAELVNLLRGDIRRLKVRFDREERERRLKRGTAQPKTATEQRIYDAGVERRAKRLTRARTRAQRDDPRPTVQPIDLDAMLDDTP